MASAQNRAKKQGRSSPVFHITIFIFLHFPTRTFAQPKPFCDGKFIPGLVGRGVFACDVKSNPGLANYTFCNPKVATADRVADLVKRLTLEENVGFRGNSAGSVSRLGIPKYEWWSEALHGVVCDGYGTKFINLVPGATSFPQVILFQCHSV